MSTVQEIEQAITGLAPHELRELYAWMEKNSPDLVDLALKADLDVGAMDERIREARAEYEAGKMREL